MKVSYKIAVEGDPVDGYDLMIDNKVIKHFDPKTFDDYELANSICSELEIPIETQLRESRKTLDTMNLKVMATEDMYDLMDEYGIESRDKIYDAFNRLGNEDSDVELGLRLDRTKGKIYVTMVNGVMLERDVELS